MKLLIAATWRDEDIGRVGRRTTSRCHIEVPTREPRTYEEDEEEDEEDARPPTPMVMSSVMAVWGEGAPSIEALIVGDRVLAHTLEGWLGLTKDVSRLVKTAKLCTTDREEGRERLDVVVDRCLTT